MIIYKVVPPTYQLVYNMLKTLSTVTIGIKHNYHSPIVNYETQLSWTIDQVNLLPNRLS